MFLCFYVTILFRALYASGTAAKPHSPSNASCSIEYLKHNIETSFRNGSAIVWNQHIQRSAGYVTCTYARANGVIDWAVKAGCPECPCGFGDDDKAFARMPAIRILETLQHDPRVRSVGRSKKDTAKSYADNTSEKTNLIELEYHTFAEYPPVAGAFVYITLLREPVERTISWISRFQRHEWNKAIASKRLQNIRRVLATFPTTRTGAFLPHSRNAYVNTFSTLSRGQPSVTNAYENLKSFNFVFRFDNIGEQLPLLERALGWHAGVRNLHHLHQTTNTYTSYKHVDELPISVIRILKQVLAPDIRLYKMIENYAAIRRNDRLVCQSDNA